MRPDTLFSPLRVCREKAGGDAVNQRIVAPLEIQRADALSFRLLSLTRINGSDELIGSGVGGIDADDNLKSSERFF
jgi:hypothetical protein